MILISLSGRALNKDIELSYICTALRLGKFYVSIKHKFHSILYEWNSHFKNYVKLYLSHHEVPMVGYSAV